MRTNRLSLLFIAAVAALPAGAQVIATLGRWPGVQVYFNAKIEPPPGPGTDPAVLRQLLQDVHGGVIVDDRVHRYWRDAEQKAYLGYDVSVEPGSKSGGFQAHILPLGLTPQQMAKYGMPETWTRLSLPKYPVVPEVRIGDTVAIDLLVNPHTGQKLVDYLTIQRTGQPLAAERPRDFSLEDAAVLFLNDPRVSVNGALEGATAHFKGGISGSAVWFYLRGRGRFVLSLVAIPAIRLTTKAGEVTDNVLTFRDGPDSFRVSCSRRIAYGAGPFNIYVLHDPNWRPRPDEDAPFILGSSRAELLAGLGVVPDVDSLDQK